MPSKWKCVVIGVLSAAGSLDLPVATFPLSSGYLNSYQNDFASCFATDQIRLFLNNMRSEGHIALRLLIQNVELFGVTSNQIYLLL